ncbi:MAG TPA: 50S ribosomal protein L18 [Candidatus Paceibacterota bacterium]|nr:50S ribosomal protein L18 [Candidatus Paceibacterota bacterium]
MATNTKQLKRQRRHNRVRAKVFGTSERPRLSVYKSNTKLVAQIINDDEMKTIVAVSSAAQKGKTPRERAEAAASALASSAKEKGISKVVFDRGGFQYLGTIKAFADAARAAGLEF